MTKTELSSNGTSFFYVTIHASINSLRQVLGDPTRFNNTGEDKINAGWTCVNDEGNVCTVYDWKEYRVIGENEMIEFHIGGLSHSDTRIAKDELLTQLSSM